MEVSSVRKYLTILQLSQFALNWFQTLLSVYYGHGCGFALWLKLVMFFYQTSMLALFSSFFVLCVCFRGSGFSPLGRGPGRVTPACAIFS